MNKLKLADLFTLANLASGFCAVLIEDIQMAAGLIVLGAFFDVLDGLVARAMKQESEMGKQLDSLADMVTFGVAPAVLFYHLLPDSFTSLTVCVLIPVFSAWRLGNFNLLPSQPHFTGLPTPANALWYVGLALWVTSPPDFLEGLPIIQILLSISVILSLMMVSKVRFPALKSVKTLIEEWQIASAAGVGLVLPIIIGYPALAINGSLVMLIISAMLTYTARRGESKST